MEGTRTVDKLYRGEAVRHLVDQVAATVTDANGFDDQQRVALRCRDVSNAPDYLPVSDDGDNGGEMVLRCKW